MIEDELRQALRDLADEGHQVDLGRTALSGARRRRRARLRNTATTVVAAVSVAAVVIPMQLVDSGAGPVPTDGPGRYVVTSYYATADQPMVLNPRTGEYQPTSIAYAECPPGADCLAPRDFDPSLPAISPDLRRFATVQGDRGRQLVVSPTDPGSVPNQATVLPEGNLTEAASWSPDGERVALWRPGSAQGAGLLDAVVIAEPDTGRAYEIPLQLPAGRSALSPVAGGLAWLDPGQLIIPTTDSERRIPGPGPDVSWRWVAPWRVVTSLSIVDLTGAVTGEVPIVQDGSLRHAGQAWVPYGQVRHGHVLLARAPEPGALQLRTMNLADGSRSPVAGVPVPPVRLPERLREDGDGWAAPDRSAGLPGAGRYGVTPEGRFSPVLVPMAWLDDRYLLAQTVAYTWEGGFHLPSVHYLIDLRTGSRRPVELPVPPESGLVTFAETGRLTPEAARRAATL